MQEDTGAVKKPSARAKWTQTEIVANVFPLYVLVVNPLAVAFILWLPTYVKTALVAMSQFITSVGLATMFCRFVMVQLVAVSEHHFV